MWNTAPARLELRHEEVHVWRVAIDGIRQAYEGYWETLAPDEKARAERYHFERDRDRFVLARGVLRMILGRYLNLAPQDVRFSYTEYGKPYLQSESAPSDITFNLTHSHKLAVLAVAHARQIGVDLEYVRPDLASESIAKRFFAGNEITALFSQPPQVRTEAFFHCWTRKEAFIKAVGEGLSYPLDQFTVAFTPESKPALLEIGGSAKEAGRWALYKLSPGEGYVGALAVERGDMTSRLQLWQWPKL